MPLSKTLLLGASLLALPLHAQSSIPLRHLTPAISTDSGLITLFYGVREIGDGRVLVNDAIRHRLTAFDSTLKHFTIVLDTAAGALGQYGPILGGLVPYMGDSTIFLDQQARAFIIIDPSARPVRTIAPPRVNDLLSIMSGSTGTQGYDPKGRLVYRVFRPAKARTPLPVTADSAIITVRYDTGAIVRADPEAQTVDTVGFVAMPVSRSVTIKGPDGGRRIYSAVNPLPETDEWTLLPDGTVAFIRSHDYHIDWVAPDGTVTSTPKMPFDWRRVTIDEKNQMLDSARKAYDQRVAKTPPRAAGTPGPYVGPFYSVAPNEMPDYYPPIRAGQVRADREGNVWILPTSSALASAGLVFDVVNRKGEVFERVALPPGRNLVAFGPSQTVYMSYTAAPGDLRLERAQISR